MKIWNIPKKIDELNSEMDALRQKQRDTAAALEAQKSLNETNETKFNEEKAALNDTINNLNSRLNSLKEIQEANAALS